MMKRLLKILTAAIAVILLFSACKQLLDDPEDFLSYWASEAFVKDHSIGSAHRADGAGIQCVASSGEAVIMLKVHNPKSFSLVMPTSSESAGIVEFKGLSEQPAAGQDYELKQTGSGTLQLIYKSDFLKQHEQGQGDLSPTITLKAKDGRVFKQTYTFGIKSNTPPPAPKEIVIAKTTEADPHYVLCLKFDSNEMEKTVTIGSGSVPVHKDITNIIINGTSYALLYNDNDTDFKEPTDASFIEYEGVEHSSNVPTGSWVLYFKTGVKVNSGNEQTSYTITLHDRGGLVSDSKTQELTKKFKVEFDVNGGDPASKPADQYIENGGLVTKPNPDPTKQNHTFDGWYTDPSHSTQWDFTTGTVTGNMTLYAKWTSIPSATYRVEHYQENLDGTYPSTTSDVDTPSGQVGSNAAVTLRTYHGFQSGTYTPTQIAAGGTTVVKVYYKRKQYDVNFSVNGSGGSINVTNITGGNKTASPVRVKHDGNVTFTAQPHNGWEVEGWTLNGSSVNGTSQTYTLSNITGPKTVTVKFKQKKYAVTFSVAGGQGGFLEGRYNGQTKTANGSGQETHTVTHGDAVNFTAYPDTGWEVDSWTGVTATPSNSTTATLSNVTGPKTVTVTFKKKKYTVTFKVDGGEGKLQGTYNSQSQTAQNGGSTKTLTNVPHGSTVNFTAQPDNGWEVDTWTGVSSSSNNASLTVDGPDKTVTVTFKPGKFNLTGGPGAWERLKEEAKKEVGAHTIIINGEITATGGADAGEITLGRDLTIRGGSGAVLNANGITGIFKVDNGKTLTLKDITLKNAQVGSTNEGGGVYIDDGGTLIMQGSTTITNCKAGKGGGVYVKGTFKMEGGALVKDDNEVYLESGKTVTVTDALTKKPAAKIRLADYQENRVLAVGKHAKKENFKLALDGSGNNWRYKKVGNEVKFVKAELKVHFKQLKCVAVHDGALDYETEYYWTIKVKGETIDNEYDANHTCDLKTGKSHTFTNKWFTRDFSSFSANETVPVNIEIWDDDHAPNDDDHIGTTKANLTYDYNNDEWRWAYVGPQPNGNQEVNRNITIGNGDEKTLTEQYRTTDGDTDVTFTISWKE